MTNVRVSALALSGGDLLVAVNDAGPPPASTARWTAARSFGPPEVRLPTVLALAVAGYRVLAGTERGCSSAAAPTGGR